MKNCIHRCLIILILFSNTVSAQYRPEYHRFNIAGQPNPGGNILPESVGFSGTGSNMDIVYHRANWTLNPNDGTKTVTGTITTYFKTLVANVSAINFDLNKASFNNAGLLVKYHGITCTISFPSVAPVNILNITLPSTIALAGTLDSIVINYSGVPPGVSGAAQGFQTTSYTDLSSVNQNYENTLSESYEDRDWWPCKADMKDKIDSMDINVTVPWTGPDTFWVSTNGRLYDSTITGANRTFKFKSRYPITSYLVAVSVAKMNRYYRSVTVGATVVPVQYHLLRGKAASYYTNATAAMDKINPVVVAFSQKFGDYPFKLEKHGFYDGLVGAGGMEHQTFSGIASNALTDLKTLSHELMHQWFGDNVSFSTWNDLWLAEGFARYAECLAPELVPSLGLNSFTIRNGFKTSALSENANSTWIPDANIANSDLIWSSAYGSTVYNRGCMVVSMLRAISGDNIFFNTLTNYQTNLKGKSATTDTLKNYFNAALGADLSGFFDDYVGGTGNGTIMKGGVGNPIYNIKWNNPSGNRLNVRVNTQTQTGGSNVAYFNGPVVLHVKGSVAGDTTIVFFDWGAGSLSYAGNGLSAPIPGNLLSYDLSFVPTTVAYDDSARTLSTGTTTPDATLTGYIWNGGTSNAWNTAANWQACCGVPPNYADVTIATTTNAPVLPGPVIIRTLILNPAKFLSIGSNTLTITGKISGTGTLRGSLTSNLLITGNAGLLSFDQGSQVNRSLASLVLGTGASAQLGNNLESTAITLNPASVFTINAGVSLITK